MMNPIKTLLVVNLVLGPALVLSNDQRFRSDYRQRRAFSVGTARIASPSKSVAGKKHCSGKSLTDPPGFCCNAAHG